MERNEFMIKRIFAEEGDLPEIVKMRVQVPQGALVCQMFVPLLWSVEKSTLFVRLAVRAQPTRTAFSVNTKSQQFLF